MSCVSASGSGLGMQKGTCAWWCWEQLCRERHERGGSGFGGHHHPEMQRRVPRQHPHPLFLLLSNINVANVNCAPGAAAGWVQGQQICMMGMTPAVLSPAFRWR